VQTNHHTYDRRLAQRKQLRRRRRMMMWKRFPCSRGRPRREGGWKKKRLFVTSPPRRIEALPRGPVGNLSIMEELSRERRTDGRTDGRSDAVAVRVSAD